MRRTAALFFLLLGAAPAAHAAPRLATADLDLHVGGPGCRTTGPGTPDRPFCTPAAAVRAAPAGARVLLRGGRYGTVRLQDVAKDRPVTVTAARGQQAVVRGIELSRVRGLLVRDLVLTGGVQADETEDLQVLRTRIALRPAGAATQSGFILGQCRDVVLRDNVVEDGRDGVNLRGHKPRNRDVVIAGNTFRRLGNDGVYIGRAAERVLVVGNRFEDVHVRREVDAAAHSDGIQVSGPTEDVVLWGNRFTGGRGILAAIFDEGPATAGQANAGLVVASNVVLGPMFGIRTYSAPGARIVHNTVWGTSGSRNSGIDLHDRLLREHGGSPAVVLANNIVKTLDVEPAVGFAARRGNLVGGDPGFKDLAAADVRLAEASPAVDAAAAAWAPTVDAAGGARVGRPDAGAYERGGRPTGIVTVLRAAVAAVLDR